MAKHSFSIRLEPDYVRVLEAAAAARAEKLGLSGYSASVGAFVRAALPLGVAVQSMSDGIPVPVEQQAAVFTSPFLRGAAKAAHAIFENPAVVQAGTNPN
jgi:hypothetical protein